MGPRAPSPVPRRRARRARPSKRARTSGPGESSSARPPPSPVASPTEATSSPQLSPASRIRRPMFVGHPIPGNARLNSRPFQQESFYDVPGLRADPRYRESMRLIEEYSLLPFMTPRQIPNGLSGGLPFNAGLPELSQTWSSTSSFLMKRLKDLFPRLRLM